MARVVKLAVFEPPVAKPICTVMPPPVCKTLVPLMVALATEALIWLASAVKVVFRLTKSVDDKPPLAACVANCCIWLISELIEVRLVCATETTF